MSTSRSAFLKTMAATSLGGGGICGGGRGCAGVAESHAAVIERISEVRVNARRPSVTIRLDHFRLAGHSPPRCWRNSAPCTLAQSYSRQATGSPLAAPGLQPSACGTVKPSAVASVTEMARPSTRVGAGRPFLPSSIVGDRPRTPLRFCGRL